MRKSELEAYRKLAKSKQKWEMVAHLMSGMLESLGVDTAEIMAADKDQAAEMLLNRHEYIRRANPKADPKEITFYCVICEGFVTARGFQVSVGIGGWACYWHETEEAGNE